jgi:hypothetical protein
VKLNDQNFAKTLEGLSSAQKNLAQLKSILDGESDYFGEAFRMTLVAAQEHANGLFDLLNLGQRQVRAREEAMRTEARKQGILPGFDEGPPPLPGEEEALAAFDRRFERAERAESAAGGNGHNHGKSNGAEAPTGTDEASDPGVTHWQVYKHADNGERYVVALRPGGEVGSGDEVVGYVEIPVGADLPEPASMPSLHFRTDPNVLEYLNAGLEPWGVIDTWGQSPAAEIQEEPRKTKRKKKSADSGAAADTAN